MMFGELELQAEHDMFGEPCFRVVLGDLVTCARPTIEEAKTEAWHMLFRKASILPDPEPIPLPGWICRIGLITGPRASRLRNGAA